MISYMEIVEKLSESIPLLVAVAFLVPIIIGVIVYKILNNKHILKTKNKILKIAAIDMKGQEFIYKKWAFVSADILSNTYQTNQAEFEGDYRVLKVGHRGLYFSSFHAFSFGVPFDYVKSIFVKINEVTSKEVAKISWDDNNGNNGEILIAVEKSGLYEVLKDIYNGDLILVK